MRSVGARKGEADLSRSTANGGREKQRATRCGPVPQTDTGRRGEYPKALEKTVLKELGNMTP
jgi:hypothetical protein